MKLKNIKKEMVNSEGDSMDERFVNPPESAYRASGSMDCIFEFFREEDGLWFCWVTRHGEEVWESWMFDTLRECKEWAERHDSQLDPGHPWFTIEPWWRA